MQNKSYSDLKALIQALAGVDAFTTAEDTKLLAMANRRLYQAYSANPVWPRYLQSAQARPAPDGVLPYAYDEATGVRTSTGTESRSGTTVTIQCTAAVDFVVGMEVVITGLGYSTTNPNGTYAVTGIDTTTITNDTFTYDVASGTGTENYTGTATVSPVAISDIESVIRIFGAQPYDLNSVQEYDFISQNDGVHIINNYSGAEGFWVAFREVWPGPYLSSAVDIPLEFFYYAAHAAYADFLRMDGQIDKAMAEESVAQTYLTLEIDKAETQRNNNAVYRRISSHASRQGR